MKMLRVHGQNKRYHHKYIGIGGRLDTIQAAVLNVKLKHYPKDLHLRQQVAEKYTKALGGKTSVLQKNPAGNNTAVSQEHSAGSKTLVLPYIDKNVTSAWAQYSIRVKNRDQLQHKLKEAGIPTAVHYPMPLHLQECFEYLGYKEEDFPIAEQISKEIMSLPMNPYIADEEIENIVSKLS